MTVPKPCRQCGRLAFPGKAVTISGEEYRELMALRQARDALAAKAPALRYNKRNKVGRDPELAGFIIHCAQTMMPLEIEGAAVEHFGRERVPSRWSIHRFLRDCGRG